MRDRGDVRDLLARARAVGCTVLVLTVDLAVTGLRHRDVQTGMTGGLGPVGKARHLADMAWRWPWLWDVGIRGRPHLFGSDLKAVSNARRLSDFFGFSKDSLDADVT